MVIPPIDVILAIAAVIFLAIGVHEYCHAKFADMAGDPTPGIYGRVTLNLTKHFEPIGTLMIAITSLTGFGIGWGKPVPMDPRRMKNPKWDHFVAVAAGPLSNLVQATIFGTIMRLLNASGVPYVPGGLLPQLDLPFFGAFLTYAVLINLALCFFNLIPLGPLDGMWLFGTFLPERLRLGWTRFNLQVGSFMLIALVLLGQISGYSLIRLLIVPPVSFFFQLLTGI